METSSKLKLKKYIASHCISLEKAGIQQKTSLKVLLRRHVTVLSRSSPAPVTAHDVYSVFSSAGQPLTQLAQLLKPVLAYSFLHAPMLARKGKPTAERQESRHSVRRQGTCGQLRGREQRAAETLVYTLYVLRDTAPENRLKKNKKKTHKNNTNTQ